MDFDLSNKESSGLFRFPITISIGGTDISVNALWDTGATCTCINERLVPQGLASESYAPTYGANDGEKMPDEVLRPQYRASISLSEYNFNNVLIRSLQMKEDAIIGMNIITELKSLITQNTIHILK